MSEPKEKKKTLWQTFLASALKDNGSPMILHGVKIIDEDLTHKTKKELS